MTGGWRKLLNGVFSNLFYLKIILGLSIKEIELCGARFR